jgi:hypothetical protein
LNKVKRVAVATVTRASIVRFGRYRRCGCAQVIGHGDTRRSATGGGRRAASRRHQLVDVAHHLLAAGGGAHVKQRAWRRLRGGSSRHRVDVRVTAELRGNGGDVVNRHTTILNCTAAVVRVTITSIAIVRPSLVRPVPSNKLGRRHGRFNARTSPLDVATKLGTERGHGGVAIKERGGGRILAFKHALCPLAFNVLYPRVLIDTRRR